MTNTKPTPASVAKIGAASEAFSFLMAVLATSASAGPLAAWFVLASLLSGVTGLIMLVAAVVWWTSEEPKS